MHLPEGLIPTPKEAHDLALHCVQHSCNVEYHAHLLKIDDRYAPEQPHDIWGPNNKFEWPVFRGLAMAYRDGSKAFQEFVVVPALARHRCQHHHQCWNAPQGKETAGEMRLGAADAICSLLEPRAYQGGSRTFPKIRQVIDANAAHHRSWMIDVAKEMYRAPRPSLHLITSLDDFPNIGLPSFVHDAIRQSVADLRTMLKKDHGIII